MDTVKGVLLILCLVLAGGIFLLSIQYGASRASLRSANVLLNASRDLLRAEGVSCSMTGFENTAKCIQPLLRQNDFKEAAFSQPDERKGTDGYLVIENQARRAYDASDFLFLWNRNEMQRGCKELTGLVGYRTACRFDFAQPCEKGTVLEVYASANLTGVQEVKVFSKNC